MDAYCCRRPDTGGTLISLACGLTIRRLQTALDSIIWQQFRPHGNSSRTWQSSYFLATLFDPYR